MSPPAAPQGLVNFTPSIIWGEKSLSPGKALDAAGSFQHPCRLESGRSLCILGYRFSSKFPSWNNFPRWWEASVMLAEGWWVHSFHNLDEPRKPSLPPNLFQPVTVAFALRPLLKTNNKVQIATDIDQTSQVRPQEFGANARTYLRGSGVQPCREDPWGWAWQWGALGSWGKAYTWRAHGEAGAQDPCGLFQLCPLSVFQNTPKGIHTWHRGGGHIYKVLSEEAM